MECYDCIKKVGMEIMNIKDYANNIGLDIECIACLGKSIKPVTGERFLFDCAGRLKANHKYIIKYFEFENVYIVWKKQNPVRQKYSLSRSDFIQALLNYNGIVEKGLEFRWKNSESVCVLDEVHIMDFLYQIKNLENIENSSSK